MSADVGNESTPATALNRPKIALIGSAPSSVNLAPYNDPSWTIWGCSPGAAANVKRVDQWFEIHPLSQADITPDYLAWLAQVNVPVALIRPDARIPKGFAYPRAQVEAEFGTYFFTSSVAWMFALAILQNPEQIGLWGIDMSATEEYSSQRAGCHFFMREALKRGIQVFVPSESDLHVAPAPYGFVMDNPMYQKLAARKRELDARCSAAAQNYENARNEWNFLRGAIDDLNYVMSTWVRE